MRSIKAVIFDLDETLFSCSEQLAAEGRRLAAAAMVEAGLAAGIPEAVALQLEMTDSFTSRTQVFGKIVRRSGREDALVESLVRAYNSGSVAGIKPFPGTISLLRNWKERGIKVLLVTGGIAERQMQKISALGLDGIFDEVVVSDPRDEDAKEPIFFHLMRKHKLVPQEVLAVGDHLARDIRAANRVGITTVQMVHGAYRFLQPLTAQDKPTYKIAGIAELEHVLFAAERFIVLPDIKVVAMGGGTGLPVVLRGLKPFTSSLTGIVTVTDSGRSTGIIRNDYDIPAPGDLRNCLIAMSHASELINRLFQFRFDRGAFEGMSFGNLLLTALTQITGSFETAVKEASLLLKVDGLVLPSTLDNVHLFAELEDGKVIEREHNVSALDKESLIRRVFIKPEDARPLAASLDAIAEADLIILGPGSLITSVVPTLLIKGMTEALDASRADIFHVLNIMTQPGETDGFDAVRHIRFLKEHLGRRALDGIVVNTGKPRADVMARYEAEHAEYIGLSDGLMALGIPIITGDMLESPDTLHNEWAKPDLLRHDPSKLASTLYGAVRWKGMA